MEWEGMNEGERGGRGGEGKATATGAVCNPHTAPVFLLPPHFLLGPCTCSFALRFLSCIMSTRELHALQGARGTSPPRGRK